MPLIGTSLNAAASTGPGAAISFDEPKSKFAMQVTYTGSPSNVEVDFEGTLDGVSWTRLFVMQNQNGPIGGNNPIGTGNVLPVLAISVRANLVSLTGGTSPTVTATVAAA